MTQQKEQKDKYIQGDTLALKFQKVKSLLVNKPTTYNLLQKVFVFKANQYPCLLAKWCQNNEGHEIGPCQVAQR